MLYYKHDITSIYFINDLKNKSKCAFGTFVYPMVFKLNHYVTVFVCRKTKRTLAGKDAIIDIDISLSLIHI